MLIAVLLLTEKTNLSIALRQERKIMLYSYDSENEKFITNKDKSPKIKNKEHKLSIYTDCSKHKPKQSVAE